MVDMLGDVGCPSLRTSGETLAFGRVRNGSGIRRPHAAAVATGDRSSCRSPKIACRIQQGHGVAAGR